MKTVTLGSTGITTPQNAFGALPVQRDDMETSIKILRRAFEGGMTFFDTARAYSDSEEKIGNALSDVREKIFIATKTAAETPEEFWKDLETSLSLLKTDYVDIYQFHQASRCYKPGDGTGMYEAMLEAKAQGKIRHIGITAHKIKVAEEAVESGLYETLQFPLSYLSGEQELALVKRCKEQNMGYIAMKALAGGLINNSSAAFAWMTQFDNVLPIWGIQRMTELEEFLAFFEKPAEMKGELLETIEKDRAELAGDFCRGCGYCLPCPAGIKIYDCARMSLMIRRAPTKNWISEEWQKEMAKIENCIHCGKCHTKCPYGLNAAEILVKNLEDYKKIISGEIKV
jgi:predicted aldo/keto reductase-like oxidoreductase